MKKEFVQVGSLTLQKVGNGMSEWLVFDEDMEYQGKFFGNPYRDDITEDEIWECV